MGIENQQREPIGCPSRKNLWQDSSPLRVLLLVTLQSLEKSELLLLRGQMICRNSVSSSETRGVRGTGYKTRSIVETLSQLTPHETHFAFRGGMTDMLTYTNADTLTCNFSLSSFFLLHSPFIPSIHHDAFSLSHSFLLPYLIFFLSCLLLLSFSSVSIFNHLDIFSFFIMISFETCLFSFYISYSIPVMVFDICSR